jgi:futalosine hydrolase
MNILLIVATSAEIAPLMEQLNVKAGEEKAIGTYQLQVLISGAGMTATAYQLGKVLAKKQFDVLINAGIGGSIGEAFKRCDVVNVTTEHFYGLGAEHHDYFLPASEIGLLPLEMEMLISSPYPSFSTSFLQQLDSLPKANGITVQTVHGNEQSIALLCQRNPSASIESMEGAAVFYAGQLEGIPVIEIRSVSNPVEPRNRAGWDIQGAIHSLNQFLIQLLNPS